jgi:polyisoprenoid-binding protein YceI
VAQAILPAARTFLPALALLACLVPAPAPAQEVVLNLDPARTTIQFTLPATLHTVHGTFKLKHGEVRFDPATGKIGGAISVDTTSGESGNESRDKRMHQSILESDRYPEIVFTPDRVEGAVGPQGASDVQVHGVFRIHGAEHEIVLPVHVEMAGGHATATTHFSVPYVKWGMKNPSTLFLKVHDQVEIEVTASAK